MRIVEVRHLAVPLEGAVANALVSFSGHDVSLVALISDVTRDGRNVAGIAFNSIGRFAQGGILESRMIPRLASAEPESLLDSCGLLDPAKVLAVAMQDEKPGGHGDRAGAAAALELAAWDLRAKLAGEPAWATISRAMGCPVEWHAVPVYAAGGYYYPHDSLGRLRDELKAYADLGFTAFKVKVGSVNLAEDLARIEAAAEVAGGPDKVSVDANGRFGPDEALAFAGAVVPLGLRWIEEIGDPLDYALNARVVAASPSAVATGENLFSVQDATNLVRHGGMRRGRDVFQMDPGLSYGLTGYMAMLAALEELGFDRAQCWPHGGHPLNLHIVAALELGGCEAYPGVFRPFGGFAADCVMGDGLVRPGEAEGFGLEEKSELRPTLVKLLE